jgi:hypothetical protein
MIPAITAVFEWLSRNLGAFLEGFWTLARRIKWFSVGIVLVSVTILEYVVGFFAWSASIFGAQTGVVVSQVRGFMTGASTQQTWASLSSGAALMNCVLPVDFMLAAGGVVMAVWFNVSVILMLLALYRLIPFKAT